MVKLNFAILNLVNYYQTLLFSLSFLIWKSLYEGGIDLDVGGGFGIKTNFDLRS